MIPERWKQKLARSMQLTLAGLLLFGLYTKNPKVIINAGIGLAVTFAPALLERNYRISVNPFLALWISSSVFFHALGSYGLYGTVWWWDHLTHALSASLVAGIGYTAVRTIDLHSEDIRLPDSFMFVFILMTVIAFGVAWEIFEYVLDLIAEITRVSMPLAQHGLKDTMKDMMFNTLGAIITATVGQAYLNEFSEKIKERSRKEY